MGRLFKLLASAVWSDMSVLVTGGAGYIGSALIDQLLKDGYHVVSIDNLYRGDYGPLKSHERGEKLVLLIGDICDVEALDRAARSADDLEAIFHLAAVPGVTLCARDPERAVMTNVYGSYNVLEVARRYDVEKVILASSAAVYGDPVKLPVNEDHPVRPKNLYGVTKLAAEHLFMSYHELYGMATVITRLGNVYGVGLFTYWDNVIPKFVRQALNGEPLTVYWTGEQTRDFIHVRDVVDGLKLILKTRRSFVSGEVFNLAVGKPTSINYVATVVKEIVQGELNIPVNIKHVPPPPERSETFIPGFCLSVKKIQKLGFRPKWSIKEGVIQLITYCRGGK